MARGSPIVGTAARHSVGSQIRACLAIAKYHHRLFHAVKCGVSLVGPGGASIFDPPEIFATRGDRVRFTLVSGNHNVTESSLELPCIPGGFDIGFINGDERGLRHVDHVVERGHLLKLPHELRDAIDAMKREC